MIALKIFLSFLALYVLFVLLVDISSGISIEKDSPKYICVFIILTKLINYSLVGLISFSMFLLWSY